MVKCVFVNFHPLSHLIFLTRFIVSIILFILESLINSLCHYEIVIFRHLLVVLLNRLPICKERVNSPVLPDHGIKELLLLQLLSLFGYILLLDFI